MKVFDMIHGYQPFHPTDLTFNWVEENLQNVFLPTSYAMKEGHIRRGIQINGWTIDSWYKSGNSIKSLAIKTIANLKESLDSGFIEVGISGYSHPILPLISEDLVHVQIELDNELISQYIGKPTWFWPPEGAINKSLLEFIFKKHPDLIVVIPDMSIGRKGFSGLVNIRHDDRTQKVLVCNTALKDMVMNASYLEQKPHYVDAEIDWEIAQEMHLSGEKFMQVLQAFDHDTHVLIRDWENKGSKDGLSKSTGEGSLDLKGLLELNVEFLTPSQGDFNNAEVLQPEDIRPGSWEIEAVDTDPFLYWWPDEGGNHWQSLTKQQKNMSIRWKNLIGDINTDFSRWVQHHAGVENILDDRDLKENLKKMMPALMSCIPWHFLAKKAFQPNPEFSERAWEKLILPSRQHLDDLLSRV